jgi:class 3 adenylate cyclase
MSNTALGPTEAPAEAQAREAATKQILDVISQSRDDEKPVFDAILKHAQRLCKAPLAFLSLVDDTRTKVYIPAQRGARPAFADVLEAFVEPIERSELLAVRPVVDPQVILQDDIADDDLYRNRDPRRVQMVEVEGVRSILVVPLISGGLGIGGIILYRREVDPFSEDDVALALNFAAQAVIAIENARQFKALEARTEEVQALNASLEARVEEQVAEIERMSRLKRFLSPAVADAVVSSGDDNLLSSHRALLGILFCDIRGFTAFCETAEPEETIEVLQTYHEEMGKLIVAHGAGVDHRWGDGIMVLFNDPLPCEDPAGDALRLAIAMRARMQVLSKSWKRLGHRLGFGVGISLGYATVGMVGSEGRFDYTANGTAVNLASRLCDEAEDGEILLSPRARIAVEDEIETESRGEVRLKGIQTPLEIFKVASAKSSEKPS